MRLSVYIDSQNNSKRNCFRVRLIDLDSNFSIDKSISFSSRVTAKKVKVFVQTILTISKKDRLRVYCNKSERTGFRIKVTDLDNRSIDKSISFRSEKDAKKVKAFIETVLSIVKKDVL